MKRTSCNPDLPSTWKQFKPEMCSTCIASCCCLPLEVKLEDLLRLEVLSLDETELPEGKIVKILKQKKIVKSYRTSSRLFMMESKSGGECIFLSKDRRCTVYEKRPDVCRSFPLSMGPRIGYCPYVAKQK